VSTYDNNGNMLTGDNFTNTWDYRNWLTQTQLNGTTTSTTSASALERAAPSGGLGAAGPSGGRGQARGNELSHTNRTGILAHRYELKQRTQMTIRSTSSSVITSAVRPSCGIQFGYKICFQLTNMVED
jgi:hypothetical protein